MFVGITLEKSLAEESVIKKRRRTKIKSIAKKLFIEQGISNTSILQIAEVAGMGRRTIYHYYNSREEIAVEVQEEFIHKLQHIEGLEERVKLCQKGIEQFEFILNVLTDHYLDHLEELEYLNEFDKSFKNVNTFKFTPLELDNYNIYKCLHKSLQQGIEDKSIRRMNEAEIKNTILTINHALIAFVARIGMRLDLIKMIYEYDIRDCKHIVSLFINGLK